ncbi:MAG: isoprenyl transferase [Ruminococcaceae bacterium]|nr:isoprenyl transferase [Oscillospiraceae bacterium]
MALFSKKKGDKNSVKEFNLPQHIGIIMDGNGRWAKKRALPRSMGHSAGAQTFRKITRYCSDIGIKHLTVYAFSTENWRRPEDEVNALMKLFEEYLNEALRDFKDDTIVVKFLGDRSAFSPKLQALINENEEESKNRGGMVLNIAMNYGGRDELVTATREIARKVKDGELSIDDINADLISNSIYTKGQPDPDLIIRPSGEFRISNFLLWQSAYAEYYISDKLWPDFTTDDLDKAIAEFSTRNRRYGGV